MAANPSAADQAAATTSQTSGNVAAASDGVPGGSRSADSARLESSQDLQSELRRGFSQLIEVLQTEMAGLREDFHKFGADLQQRLDTPNSHNSGTCGNSGSTHAPPEVPKQGSEAGSSSPAAADAATAQHQLQDQAGVPSRGISCSSWPLRQDKVARRPVSAPAVQPPLPGAVPNCNAWATAASVPSSGKGLSSGAASTVLPQQVAGATAHAAAPAGSQSTPVKDGGGGNPLSAAASAASGGSKPPQGRRSSVSQGSKKPTKEKSKRGISSHRARQSSNAAGVFDKPRQEKMEGFWRRHALSTEFAPDCRSRATTVVNHAVFEQFVAAAILLNGVMVGVQTDYMARHVTDSVPFGFSVLEIFFCAIFTTELFLKLYAYRCRFFYMSGYAWNIFDFLIVTIQWAELLMEVVAAGVGFSFNLLRILRLVRVVRLARALRLIGELRTIVSSIAGSLKSLFWTGVLLFMTVYVLGIGITQIVLNKRLSLKVDGAEDPYDLRHYWGSLVPAILALFESITGGIDWDQAARPLIDHVSPWMGLLYAFYITFVVLAMLNVVTGVFIESVMANRTWEKEDTMRAKIIQLFREMDVENSGEISWEQFEEKLHTKEMAEFFKIIDVAIGDARHLFELLDIDGSESISMDEFVEGCLKIWAPSKGLDLQVIHRELKRMRKSYYGDSEDNLSFQFHHPSHDLKPALEGVAPSWQLGGAGFNDQTLHSLLPHHPR